MHNVTCRQTTVKQTDSMNVLCSARAHCISSLSTKVQILSSQEINSPIAAKADHKEMLLNIFDQTCYNSAIALKKKEWKLSQNYLNVVKRTPYIAKKNEKLAEFKIRQLKTDWHWHMNIT